MRLTATRYTAALLHLVLLCGQIKFRMFRLKKIDASGSEMAEASRWYLCDATL